MNESTEVRFKFWNKEVTEDGAVIYTVPSTRATVTVDSVGLMPAGNFRNMNSDEHGETIAVMTDALAAHKIMRHARAEAENARKEANAAVSAALKGSAAERTSASTPASSKKE